MERAVAVKKLAKLLGKDFAYEVKSDAPDRERREQARTELELVLRRRERASKLVEARREQILAADGEYQSLLKDWKQAREAANKLQGVLHHFKITVGTANKLFFHVKAQGDSWEEVIHKVSEERRA